MTTLNLTAEQNQNLLIGYGAANAVYDINKTGGVNLVVGQPLTYQPDMAGQPGYIGLPIAAPIGFIVEQVIKSQPSGADIFIAYNADTHTAIVGVAGMNGVLSTAPGSVLDTMQALKGMTDQIRDFFKEGGFETLRALSTQNGESGAAFHVIEGGQSGAGPLIDVLSLALTSGLNTDNDMVKRWELPGTPGEGIANFDYANLFASKLNTEGSGFALNLLGMGADNAQFSEAHTSYAQNATSLNMVAYDIVTGVRDAVNSLNGSSLGQTCIVGANYNTQSDGFLNWFHRVEGAFADYLVRNNNNLNTCTVADPIVLPMETTMALLSAFKSMDWDVNRPGTSRHL